MYEGIADEKPYGKERIVYLEYNDEAKKIIRETIDLMKIIWKGGNDFYEKNELLDLE